MPRYQIVLPSNACASPPRPIFLTAAHDRDAVDFMRTVHPRRRRELWRQDFWVEELPPEG
jgi:hypothetical protein